MIENLVSRERIRSRSVESCDLFVAATYYLIVDNHASTTELWEDFLSEFLESEAEVSDLFLTLLWILVHAEHVEDELLVLDVACGNEFLEAFPVLSGIFASNVVSELRLLELLFYIFL